MLSRSGSPSDAGISSVNTEPCPGTLSTLSSPPISRASERDNGRPRPVPLTLFCSRVSTCENSSKMRSWSSAAMPMPVSRTPKTTTRRPRSSRAVTRTSPCSVNFSALEIRLRRIWATLASSVYSAGKSCAGSNINSTDGCRQQRPQRAAQRAEQAGDSEPHRLDVDLAGLDLGEVEQVVDEFEQAFRRAADIADLPLLFGRQFAVDAVEQQARQRQHRIQRRAEFVAHVGQEARLQLARLAQLLGAVVELGIKRDHAAIGIAELLVELLALFLAAPDLFQALHQLAVLLAQAASGSDEFPFSGWRRSPSACARPGVAARRQACGRLRPWCPCRASNRS